jgi:PadR family transcriptional regulator, regulatory protein AphA
MKLKPPSYLMLGMLRLGARSGYAIKRTADLSTKYFWPTSLAQVYPELARLENAGLVSRSDDPHGARTRSAYRLTDAGETALLAWLRSPRQAPVQVRDEGLLRLFFADALPPKDQITVVQRVRESDQAAATRIRTEILPLTDTAKQSGTRFPALVAELSADIYTYAAEWLTRLEAEIEAELPEPDAHSKPITSRSDSEPVAPRDLCRAPGRQAGAPR